MTHKITVFFIVSVIAFLTLSISEVESGVDFSIPPEAANHLVKKVDDWLSCSRYDGYAACFHRGGGKNRRDREANECNKANVWDYKHLGGTCWCFKCK